jgi:hypothetical protein
LIHCNITAHPSATWTLQQLREAIGFQDRYEFLLHDRDSIFAKHLDESIAKLGVQVLKSPPHSPTANAICERVRIRRRQLITTSIPDPDIACARMLPCGRTPYWVVSTMSISWHQPSRR